MQKLGQSTLISPEGVEEEILEEEYFVITKTKGGKFRTYQYLKKECQLMPYSVKPTQEEAEKDSGTAMSIIGSLKIDAKATVDRLINIISKREIKDNDRFNQ